MLDIFRIILCIIVNIIAVFVSFIPVIRKSFIFTSLVFLNNVLFGFNKPIVKDYRKFKHESNIIVYQHNSYIDPYLLIDVFKMKNINFILTTKFADSPFMKDYIKNLGFLVINPKLKNNSKLIVNNIKKGYLAIAPSGGKGDYYDKIGKFSTGAFVAMKPITPVLIRYKDDKGTWFREDCTLMKNYKEWFLKVYSVNKKLFQPYIIILEEITAEGCSTPREYADKVEKYMKLNSQMLPPMT